MSVLSHLLEYKKRLWPFLEPRFHRAALGLVLWIIPQPDDAEDGDLNDYDVSSSDGDGIGCWIKNPLKVKIDRRNKHQVKRREASVSICH